MGTAFFLRACERVANAAVCGWKPTITARAGAAPPALFPSTGPRKWREEGRGGGGDARAQVCTGAAATKANPSAKGWRSKPASIRPL